jgi:NAD(P)-dependent dehydrogenase (short-subunit alcohol dehydrogenase family)
VNGSKRRVCLLTGASGRLGTVFCRRFARRYDIVAVTRTRELPVPTQDQQFLDPLHPDVEIPANRHAVFAVQADLSDESDRRRVVEVALARFGRIDLLVNAAVHTTPTPLLALDDDGAALAEHFTMNAAVPVSLAALVARSFWLGRAEENERRNRNVVNLSSTAGTFVATGRPRLAAYGASKAALNYLSCQLARQLEPHGVRVNVLAPTTFPRIVRTVDVADQVVALDRSRDTGTIVVLNEEGCFTL